MELFPQHSGFSKLHPGPPTEIKGIIYCTAWIRARQRTLWFGIKWKDEASHQAAKVAVSEALAEEYSDEKRASVTGACSYPPCSKHLHVSAHPPNRWVNGFSGKDSRGGSGSFSRCLPASSQLRNSARQLPNQFSDRSHTEDLQNAVPNTWVPFRLRWQLGSCDKMEPSLWKDRPLAFRLWQTL